jgi:probable rRNA maturation factor
MGHKGRVPSARALSRFLREAQTAVQLRGLVSVLLTTDREIRRLNRRFRGKNKATDVLSFPAWDPSQVSKTRRPGAPKGQRVSGDLAISVETARRQAAEQGHSLAVEVKVLMLHGLLHLAGYDHETDDGRMARRERLLRARLGLPLGLIERSEETEVNGGSRLPTLPPQRRRPFAGDPALATKRSRKDGAPNVHADGASRLPALATEKSRKDGARSFRVKDKTEDRGVAGRRKAGRA